MQSETQPGGASRPSNPCSESEPTEDRYRCQDPVVKTQAANRYVYILVRRDIPEPHRQVQIAHAAIAATIAFNSQSLQPHPHLVVCAVEDERELLESFNRLKEQGVPCCEWREDDMGNQATAVATAPLQGKMRRPLREFRLLS